MTSPNANRRLRRARHPARRLVALFGAMAVALAGGLLGAGPAAPGVALAMGSLPACRYDDILTTPRAYDAWPEILVDTILRIPKTYVPPDLVSVNVAGIGGAGQVRALVVPELTAMTAAAKANGTPIAVQSAYRSYATQITTFQYWVNLSGYKQALLYSARPGHSEHQLGLAIDFKSAAGGPPWSGSDWGTSPAGAWMKAHAWEFGFIQSYPKGQVKRTCYDYESWHFRYVGRDEAAAIHASGLTLREYLWTHFTTSVVGTAGGGSPSRPASMPPSAAASSAASEQPSLAPGTAGSPDTSSAMPAASPTPAVPGRPTGSAPPVAPAASTSGIDPATLAALVGLAVVVVALIGSLAMSRRKSAGMARKGGSG